MKRFTIGFCEAGFDEAGHAGAVARHLGTEGHLNAALIREKWAEHLSGARNWHHEMWAVLMFQAWLE